MSRRGWRRWEISAGGTSGGIRHTGIMTRSVENLTSMRVGDCYFLPFHHDRLCDSVSGYCFLGSTGLAIENARRCE